MEHRKIDAKTRKELTKNILFMNENTWYSYAIQDRITVLHFLSSVDLVSRSEIPTIREFAEQYGDKYYVGVIDAGLAPEACRSCSVIGVPCMVVLRGGVILAIRNGRLDKDGGPELLLQLNAWQQASIEHVDKVRV